MRLVLALLLLGGFWMPGVWFSQQGAQDPPAAPPTAGFAPAWRQARRMVIAVIGGSVVLFGIALMVLPKPASLVIPAGLAILATEFVWAKRLLRRARTRAQALANKLRRTRQKDVQTAPEPKTPDLDR
jgi:hypothetical protein